MAHRLTSTSDPRLGLWLDANYTASLSIDGADGIAAWHDRFGNYDFSQANAALRPTYTQTINNRRVITFNGADQYLAGTGALSTLIGLYAPGGPVEEVYELFVVFRPHGSSANANMPAIDNPCILADAGGYFGAGALNDGILNDYWYGYHWDGADREPKKAHAGWNQTQLATQWTRGGKVSVRINGGVLNEVVSGRISDQTNIMRLGRNYGAGADKYYDGDLGELVMYRGRFDAAERRLVEEHLAAKWAITLV